MRLALSLLLLAGCATGDAAKRGAPSEDDLAATRVEFAPSPPRAGQPLTIRYFIRNLGKREIHAGSYEVEFYINDWLLSFDYATSKMEPGQIVDYHFTYAEPLKANEVLRYRLVVDCRRRIAESNEENNVLEGSVTVNP